MLHHENKRGMDGEEAAAAKEGERRRWWWGKFRELSEKNTWTKKRQARSRFCS